MKNLTQIRKDQSVKAIKKTELKKVKGGTANVIHPDIYDL